MMPRRSVPTGTPSSRYSRRLQDLASECVGLTSVTRSALNERITTLTGAEIPEPDGQ